MENGIVEVFTEFEGNEFVIERLTQGAIINSRCFFMEDLMAVNIRCAKRRKCSLLILSLYDFEDLQDENFELRHKV